MPPSSRDGLDTDTPLPDDAREGDPISGRRHDDLRDIEREPRPSRRSGHPHRYRRRPSTQTLPTGAVQFLIDGQPYGTAVALVNGVASAPPITTLATAFIRFGGRSP